MKEIEKSYYEQKHMSGYEALAEYADCVIPLEERYDSYCDIYIDRNDVYSSYNGILNNTDVRENEKQYMPGFKEVLGYDGKFGFPMPLCAEMFTPMDKLALRFFIRGAVLSRKLYSGDYGPEGFELLRQAIELGLP